MELTKFRHLFLVTIALVVIHTIVMKGNLEFIFLRHHTCYKMKNTGQVKRKTNFIPMSPRIQAHISLYTKVEDAFLKRASFHLNHGGDCKTLSCSKVKYDDYILKSRKEKGRQANIYKIISKEKRFQE